MRKLKRLLKRLIASWKGRPYIKALKEAIEKDLGHKITLKRGGARGRDSIFKVFHGDKVIGMARFAFRERSHHITAESNQPFRRIPANERVEYEWNCCEKGSPKNLTPAPIWKSDAGILVSCHEGGGYDNHFYANPEKFWDYIMRANKSLKAWHDMGMVHMDASLGNIVGDAEMKDAWLIDFEYIPAKGLSFGQQKAYDYLRMVESSYKFVPKEVLKNCDAWAKQLAEILDEETKNADLTPVWIGAERVHKNEYLFKVVQNVFKSV